MGSLSVGAFTQIATYHQEYIKRGRECRTAHKPCVTAVRMVHDLC